MRNHWWIPMIVACALAVGCKKDSESAKTSEKPAASTEDKAATTPTEAEKPKTDDTQALEPRKPVVTLLEPGAEPRRELRYHVKEGDSYVLDMRMKMGVKTMLKGAPTPAVDIPAMLMSMKLTVSEVKDDTFKYQYELTKADIDSTAPSSPAVANAMKQSLSAAVGMKGKATVDSRGMTAEGSVELPEGVPAQMKQMIEGLQQSVDQMSAPLPKEAVGVGAKWKVDQVIAQNGITMTQVATFTLAKLTDDQAELTVELTQNAPAQDFKAPGLPQSARLTSMKGTGSGSTTLHFDQLAPVKSAMELSNETAIDVKVGQATQSMNTQTTMALTLEGHP